MFKLVSKLFDSNQKEINRLNNIVAGINSFEEEVKKLKDGQFVEKTAELKNRLANGETLDELLAMAFALVREASARTIGERHYDVQMMAALTLHRGAVAEQKTGGGKSLSTIPALSLNALNGPGTDLVTFNDFLARRGSGWMGPDAGRGRSK